MNDVQPSLLTVLKRLKLSGLAPTLPDRAAYAKKAGLAPLDFLELALSDEIGRRDHKNLSNRLDRAGFDELHTFEDFDWDAPVTFDRDRVRDLFSLGFLDRHEDILFLGPVGVGKTFLACACWSESPCSGASPLRVPWKVCTSLSGPMLPRSSGTRPASWRQCCLGCSRMSQGPS